MAAPHDRDDRSDWYETREADDLHTTIEGAEYRKPTDPHLMIVLPKIHDSCHPPPPMPDEVGECPRCKGHGFTRRAFETMTAIYHVSEESCWVCDGTGLATQGRVEQWSDELLRKQRAK